MNILIIHAHWNNRGDEAALRAMIDSLLQEYPNARITVLINSNKILQFPYKDNVIAERAVYPRTRDVYRDTIPCFISNGRIFLTKRGRQFSKFVKEADIVLHAPGGPSIGDIYAHAELPYIFRLLVIRAIGKPYVFYAPSMGPFEKNIKHRNILRKKILESAHVFCLREPISKQYIKVLNANCNPTVTLDSAFQFPVDEELNSKKLEEYKELDCFLSQNQKVVGMTITDLAWNPQYSDDRTCALRIKESFEMLIKYLETKGYAVLFIPQLFGTQNDKAYMESFSRANCFVMDDTYDCYFQQYIISKMYALIGMRYHSNIFSAKMCSPFLSVAYEQKMSGFMDKMNLQQYCLDIKDLSFEELKLRFERIENNYDEYKNYLKEKKYVLRSEARKTTEMVIDYLKKNNIE